MTIPVLEKIYQTMKGCNLGSLFNFLIDVLIFLFVYLFILFGVSSAPEPSVRETFTVIYICNRMNFVKIVNAKNVS